jgi:hypothetical protein
VLTISETAEEKPDNSENIDPALKDEEGNASIVDLDGPTMVVWDEEKPRDSTSTKINGTKPTDRSHSKSPSLIEGVHKGADTASQPARVARSTSRASNTPTPQLDEMSSISKPANVLEVAEDPTRRLVQLQEYAVYSVELLQKHGAEIDRLFDAVDRIEDTQDDLRSSMKDTRTRLQRLERKCARPSTPEPNIDSEEIEIITNSISQISNKLNEIDTLKLAMSLFKTRIKRLESSYTRHAQSTSPEKAPSPGMIPQEPHQEPPEQNIAISQPKLKRKRGKTTSEVDEDEEYASMIEDMRHQPSQRKNDDISPPESTKTRTSQRSQSPSRSSNNVLLDRASSLPVKYTQPRLQPRSSSLTQKKPRPTDPNPIRRRLCDLSQSTYQPEPDNPRLGVEEEDTWDPLAEVEDVSEYRPLRAIPAKPRGNNNPSNLRDLRLKNMASKVQKVTSSAVDGLDGRRPSSSEEKGKAEDESLAIIRALGAGLLDGTYGSEDRLRAAKEGKEREKLKRDERDREASVAMRMDGSDVL